MRLALATALTLGSLTLVSQSSLAQIKNAPVEFQSFEQTGVAFVNFGNVELQNSKNNLPLIVIGLSGMVVTSSDFGDATAVSALANITSTKNIPAGGTETRIEVKLTPLVPSKNTGIYIWDGATGLSSTAMNFNTDLSIEVAQTELPRKYIISIPATDTDTQTITVVFDGKTVQRVK